MKLSSKFLVLFFLGSIIFIGCSSESKTISFDPRTLDFGSVNLGEFSEIDITLKNKTGKVATITNLDLSGSSDYIIVNGGSVPHQLEKNETLAITIHFEPTTGGTLESELIVKISESTKEYSVAILGNGVPVPRIEVPVTSHDYGIIINNSTDSYDFEIKNVGTADLVLDQLNISGAGAALFTITSGGAIPVTINPGVTHILTVQFAPLVDGKYSATLSISHNAVNELSPIAITLDGEGISHAPEITLSETSPWDFGGAAVSYPKILNLEISSTGIHNLTVSSLDLTNGTDFTIDSVEDSNGNPINLPHVISVGDKIIVKIQLLATAVVTYNDTLSISHDGINEPTPLDVSLTGTGKNPTTVTHNYTGSIVNWTVPAGVTTVVIEVWGAEGNYSTSSSINPGLGARMKGTFSVTPGDTLKLLVGEHRTGGNGGGGGTFVCKSNNDPMIIAGGGGGSARTTDSQNKHGNITTTGGTGAAGGGTGGTSGDGGNAGSTAWNAGAGGGLLTNGADGSGSGYGGKAFVIGGIGGGTSSAKGGFGGGGCGSSYVVGGGGGGYSGGGGGGNSSAGVGGGGGSYNAGTNQSNSGGVNSGHGKIEITY